MALNFLKLASLLAEKLADVNSNKEVQKTAIIRKTLRPIGIISRKANNP